MIYVNNFAHNTSSIFYSPFTFGTKTQFPSSGLNAQFPFLFFFLFGTGDQTQVLVLSSQAAEPLN